MNKAEKLSLFGHQMFGGRKNNSTSDAIFTNENYNDKINDYDENKDENGSVEENDTRQTALWPELSSQEFKQSVTSLK
jgi:hypothetical protein